MKNRENEKYVKWGITGAILAAFAILFAHRVFNGGGHPGGLGLLIKILRPFAFGGAMAYLVAPLSRWINHRVFHDKLGGLSDVLALVIALLVVVGTILLIVPQLVNNIIGIAKAAPSQFNALQANFQVWLNDFIEAHPEHAAFINDVVSKANAWIDGFIQNNLGSPETIFNRLRPLLSGYASQVTGVVGTLNDLMIGAIVALYFLSRRTQLAAQATMILRGALKPRWAEWTLNEVKFADRMFNGFFAGKLLDSAIIGAICFVGCLAMGFGSPLLIAVIVGVTNIIPFFGPFIGAIPSALLLLLENPMHALMFLIFIIILQQLDGNVIGPKILGDSTGLSALWVMFGILLFGGLWGILGMLVGVPLMAVIYDIVRQLTFNGLRQKGYEAEIEAYNRRFHKPAAPKGKKAK